MFKGRTRYTEFLRAEEGIATNVLADRLARLESDGLVLRDLAADAAATPTYRLTEKGIDLLPVLLEVIAWSAKHDPRTAADRAFVGRLRSDRRGLEREIRSELLGRLGKRTGRASRAAGGSTATAARARSRTKR
jgi:DNA-binding HxlR family transcriptional regulator